MDRCTDSSTDGVCLRDERGKLTRVIACSASEERAGCRCISTSRPHAGPPRRPRRHGDNGGTARPVAWLGSTNQQDVMGAPRGGEDGEVGAGRVCGVESRARRAPRITCVLPSSRIYSAASSPLLDGASREARRFVGQGVGPDQRRAAAGSSACSCQTYGAFGVSATVEDAGPGSITSVTTERPVSRPACANAPQSRPPSPWKLYGEVAR